MANIKVLRSLVFPEFAKSCWNARAKLPYAYPIYVWLFSIERLTLLRLKFRNPNVGLEPRIVVDVVERVVGRFNKREGLRNLKIRMVIKLTENQFNSNVAFELFIRLKAITSVQITIVKTIVKSQFSN